MTDHHTPATFLSQLTAKKKIKNLEIMPCNTWLLLFWILTPHHHWQSHEDTCRDVHEISLCTIPVIAASPTYPPRTILPTFLTPFHVTQEQHKPPSGFRTQTTLSAHGTCSEVIVPISNNDDMKNWFLWLLTPEWILWQSQSDSLSARDSYRLFSPQPFWCLSQRRKHVLAKLSFISFLLARAVQISISRNLVLYQFSLARAFSRAWCN